MRPTCLSLAFLFLAALACGDDSTGPDGGDDPRGSVPGTFSTISANNNGTCAVTDALDAYCWGSNAQGALGSGSGGGNLVPRSTVPVLVAGDLSVTSLGTGTHHSCVVTMAGAAYCWGRNNEGELGDDSGVPFSDVPVQVSGAHDFRSVSAGQLYACGVTTSNDAYCWGDNTLGKLGDGSFVASRDSPALVAGDLSFASVTTGNFQTCGITTTQSAYCWGGGPLGDGTSDDRNEPVAVTGGLFFESIVPGFSHTCGITTDNDAYCWGSNHRGQLGDGTGMDSDLPVRVVGDLAFSSITAGDAHTCGATAGGDAYCWGWNGLGQLGTGSTDDSDVPVPVAGGLRFESVSGRGAGHTCGITTNGAAYCWGLNRSGELGDGTEVDSTVPVRVSDPSPES